jgi:hypothetical protein
MGTPSHRSAGELPQPEWYHPYRGGFPIRLAKTQHLDEQRDSEKKKNAIRKSSARNDQIRGIFGSPP